MTAHGTRPIYTIHDIEQLRRTIVERRRADQFKEVERRIAQRRRAS